MAQGFGTASTPRVQPTPKTKRVHVGYRSRSALITRQARMRAAFSLR